MVPQYNTYWTLNMPLDLAVRAEKWCDERGFKRSVFVKDLIKSFLDSEDEKLHARQLAAARMLEEDEKKEQPVEKPAAKTVEQEADEALAAAMGKGAGKK